MAVLAVVAAAAGCGGGADDTIRIGLLPPCLGSVAGGYEPTIATAQLPLIERGARLSGKNPSDGLAEARIGGKDVLLIAGCESGGGNATDKVQTLLEVRRLVERERANIVIVSQTDTSGVAIREYAKRHPEATFLLGWGYTQSATLRAAAPNVFSFYPNTLQQAAALGAYAYGLGWRRAVTIDDDTSWGYAETAGFIGAFCALGGDVIDRVWLLPFDIGNPSPARVAAQVARLRVDGAFFGAPDPQLLGALSRVAPFDRGLAATLVATWWSIGDPANHRLLGRRLSGVVVSGAGSPWTFAARAIARYVESYRTAFPGQAAFWSLFGSGIATYTSMEAVARALEDVDGELSDGGRTFQRALADVSYEAPIGRVHLDTQRQVVATGYLGKRQDDGSTSTFLDVRGIEQTLGDYFTPDSPAPGRTEPVCRRLEEPPGWMIRVARAATT